MRGTTIDMTTSFPRGFSSAKRRMKICLGAILLLISTSAMAATSVGHEDGGWFSDFDPIVKRHNRTGELFRIEGRCQSACTMFLAIRNVCVDPAARLMFHAGHDDNYKISAWATRHMMRAYNERLRAFVASKRYMATFDYHAIPGRELIQRFGYRECPRKNVTLAAGPTR